MSSYWYQKEYANGDLYQAFFHLQVGFSSELFITTVLSDRDCSADDTVVFEKTLHQLCLKAITVPKVILIIKERGFVFEKDVEGNKISCWCKKVKSGWLFRVRGLDSEVAKHFCWLKLNNEHPLAKADTVCVGPSQHPNFTPALLCG